MANKIFEVPLDTGRPQQLAIMLAQIQYQLTVRYRNVTEGGWILDIASSSGQPIITGIPLVTGADLLAQHKHLGIPGRLWVQTTEDPDAVPTYVNLGDAAKLYFVTG